jgi:hypothetical protein
MAQFLRPVYHNSQNIEQFISALHASPAKVGVCLQAVSGLNTA